MKGKANRWWWEIGASRCLGKITSELSEPKATSSSERNPTVSKEPYYLFVRRML
ncbi:MAG: hypothetical protein IJ833_06535 [Lachnospiraceae bacterium]|nr:hypothetical protein [Lachnospiraceae bacterium]